jgi:hypothetical protein
MTGLACHRQLGGDAEQGDPPEEHFGHLPHNGSMRAWGERTKVDRRWNVYLSSCATVFVDDWPESLHSSPSCLRQLGHRFAVTHRKECARFAG